MQGQLFTQDFLLRGVLETSRYKEALASGAFADFEAAIYATYKGMTVDSSHNEAQTESEIIHKVLAELGWGNGYLPQVNMSHKRREHVPDLLLFASLDKKTAALKEQKDERRYLHGVALLEAKRWMRALDRGEAANGIDPDAPSTQILSYLSRADAISDCAVKWGILTNGSVWRLYWQDARSRVEDFLELDIGAALCLRGTPCAKEMACSALETHAFRLLYLFFHRDAFLPQNWDRRGRTFHAIALDESRLYEERVSKDLGDKVFTDIFAQLADALATGDLEAKKHSAAHYSTAYLDELREATLVLLYRLLFLFYAEDRNLLPAHDERYIPRSVRHLRGDINLKIGQAGYYLHETSDIWHALTQLSRLIDQGSDEIGLPAYNGGLFSPTRSALLLRTRVSDKTLAPIIHALSHRTDDVLGGWINYRDLSVAHLGSIYERLLEYSLVHETGEGIDRITGKPASFARKVSGSYYTHHDLVRLVLKQSVGTLCTERMDAFTAHIQAIRKKTVNPGDWESIDALDPASQILELKICDPSMGSGHFLVALVDFLTDQVLTAIANATVLVSEQAWAAHLIEDNRTWQSPLLQRAGRIRQSILATAKAHNWNVPVEQLDDRHIVRRMILKKSIFGVDKNPMAVELAKTALWLHTFTVGAPLSFLDHHLQVGDSLHGERLSSVQLGLSQFGTLLMQGELSRLETVSKNIAQIADLTDADIAEAHLSKELNDEAKKQIAPIHALLDFWRAMRWQFPNAGAGLDPKGSLKDFDDDLKRGFAALLSPETNLMQVVSDGVVDSKLIPQLKTRQLINALLDELRSTAKRETFFHWWTAFPTVWNAQGTGGFDAVIGNPPWDVAKLEEIKWFAQREPSIAFASNASERGQLIEALKTKNQTLHESFLLAQRTAEASARVLRDCGDYPLLSGGDINLYRVFVERCEQLTNVNGIVALVVPSDITTGRTSSQFFKTLIDSNRVRTIFDFENRGVFFPDVHRSQKFCVFVFGAQNRQWDDIECAFYVTDADQLDQPGGTFKMTGKELTAPNANTGGAAMFRTPKDAQLAAKIYTAYPIFVDRTQGEVVAQWPLKYSNLFHMSGDSKLFKRKDALIKAKWKPMPLRQWRSADDRIAVPLYEGKMVQLYDHRAAEIVINPANLHRPAQEVPVSVARKANPSFLPDPQYWVATDDFQYSTMPSAVLGFKDVTSPTNVRSAIAAFIPSSGAGHTFPLLMPQAGMDHGTYLRSASLFIANLNSFACDFFLRQKLQTQHLTLFVLEQLPVITPAAFDQPLPRKFVKKMREAKLMNGMRDDPTVADCVIPQVLALTYTAIDMAAFATDLGFVDKEGVVLPPFVWNETERRDRMAALDAVFFYLYGLDADDAAYIMDSFPIVCEQDTKAFGQYQTKVDVLAWLALLV